MQPSEQQIDMVSNQTYFNSISKKPSSYGEIQMEVNPTAADFEDNSMVHDDILCLMAGNPISMASLEGLQAQNSLTR